jgi:uncharacterized protein YjiS (DUF1127 family)
MFRHHFETFLATVARDRVRRQTIRELRGLNDHLLADIGVLRADIPEFAGKLMGDTAMPHRDLLGRTGPSTRMPAAFNLDLLAFS